MNIKSHKGFWSGLMFIATGVAFAWGAQSYNIGSSARPGSAYFPFGLGVLMVILGALVLFQALTIETDDGEPVGKLTWKPLITILLGLTLFGLLLPHLGMALTVPVLVIVASLAGDEFHWRDVIINSVVLAVGSWAIFILGLKLVIPLWPVFLAAN